MRYASIALVQYVNPCVPDTPFKFDYLGASSRQQYKSTSFRCHEIYVRPNLYKYTCVLAWQQKRQYGRAFRDQPPSAKRSKTSTEGSTLWCLVFPLHLYRLFALAATTAIQRKHTTYVPRMVLKSNMCWLVDAVEGDHGQMTFWHLVSSGIQLLRLTHCS